MDALQWIRKINLIHISFDAEAADNLMYSNYGSSTLQETGVSPARHWRVDIYVPIPLP